MRILIVSFLLFLAGQLHADETKPLEKVLIVGSEQDYPPFALGKTDEAAGGFTVELWRAVAAESNIKYSLRVKPFYQLLEEFKTGQIDVLINLAQSEERHRYADFSVPTVIVKGAAFIHQGDARFRSQADFAGKSIIVLNHDLAHDYAISKGWQRQLFLVDTAEIGLKLLDAGQHDLMLLSKVVGLQTLEKLKLSNVELSSLDAGFSQRFSFAVREGESDLLAKINDGLAIIKANGVYDQLFEQWFAIYEANESLKQLIFKFLVPIVSISAFFLFFFYYKWRKEKAESKRALLAYQKRTQLALEGADLGLWDWNVHSGHIYFNDRWCQMLGYKPEEITPSLNSWETLVHPDDWRLIKPVLHDHMQGKLSRYESEHRLLHKEGHWIWVLDRGKVMERGAKGEPLRVVGTHLDITSRKKNQDYLENLLAEQNAMLDNDMVGIAKVRDSVFIWANPSFEKMLGYGRHELIGKPTCELFFSEDDYLRFTQACYPFLTKQKPYREVVKQICKDGRTIWIDLSCNVIDAENNELMGIIVDVTEQKLAEDARLEVLNRINKIAGELPGFIFQYCLKPDGSSCFPYASDGIKDIYRINPDDVRDDATLVFKIIHPEDYNSIIDTILASAGSLTHWLHEYRVQFADGTVRWLHGSALPSKQKDGSILWHGFISDITERKILEKLFQESQVRHELILNSAELAALDWNIQTGVIFFNEQWAKMRGLKLDEIKQHISEWEKSIHPDDFLQVKRLLKEHFKSPLGYFNAEYRVLKKSGEWIWVLGRAAVIEKDDHGKPLRMAGTEMEITERKLAEEALRNSQERLELALQGANDGLWDWNLSTNEVYYSPRWKSMLGYAESDIANSFKTWETLVEPTDAVRTLKMAKDYVEGRLANYEIEFRMRHKEGHWVDILSRAKLAVDKQGRKLLPMRLIGTHVDISERKNLEQQRLEQEKKHRMVLVREVHHRIKNNIQGISGILRQFANQHPVTLEPINHAISQMQSIAVIYGLQGVDSMSRVRLAELLAAIIKGIEVIWNINVQRNIMPSEFQHSVAETEAVPLALVINELLVNSIKHAEEPVDVNVSLINGLTQDSLVIYMQNKGRLPVGFDYQQRQQVNTGLELVASLIPRSGVSLQFEQQGDSVLTMLECQTPIIFLDTH